MRIEANRRNPDFRMMSKTVVTNTRFHSALWKSAAVVCAAMIFGLSTQSFGPSLSSELLQEFLDSLHVTISLASFEILHQVLRKLAHPAEYAVFAVLLYGSTGARQPFAWRPRQAMWCFAIAAAYSLTDEFHQLYVPGRGPSLTDCGIDALGGALGIFACYMHFVVSHKSQSLSIS